MGVRGWQIPHRSDLVGLSLLASQISQHQLWIEHYSNRLAAGRNLYRGGRWLHRWRLALRIVYQTRMVSEPRTKDGYAYLRPCCRADYFRRARLESVGR